MLKQRQLDLLHKELFQLKTRQNALESIFKNHIPSLIKGGAGAGGGSSLGTSIETGEVTNKSITLPKMADGTANNFIGYNGSGVAVDKGAPSSLWSVLADYEATGNDATETLSFAAVDFDDDSLIIVVIDGDTNAALELQMRPNNLVGGSYYTDGHRLDAGVETLLDVNGQTSWPIVTATTLNAALEFHAIITIQLNKAGADRIWIVSECSVYQNGFERNIGHYIGGPTSLSSIVIKTSTSTWALGTRITVYKVARA